MSRILALSALLIVLPLAGCGGGSNGPSKSAATPTPANLSCTARTYRPNYINNSDPGFKLLHWPVFPLRVFFVADAQNTAARRALAARNFDKWAAVTHNGATYQVVSRPSDANVTVNFYKYNGGAGDVLGRTYLKAYDQSDTIESAIVNIGITGDNANDGITATHEFGHALGIYGHSADADDLMYFEGNDTRCGCITPADVNTLLTAYCGDFNHNANLRVAPHRGKLKTIVID